MDTLYEGGEQEQNRQNQNSDKGRSKDSLGNNRMVNWLFNSVVQWLVPGTIYLYIYKDLVIYRASMLNTFAEWLTLTILEAHMYEHRGSKHS